MEIIAIETSAYKSIMDTLEEIKKNSSIKGSQNSLSEEWLDGEKVCKILGVTSRTLQNYRHRGILPYSHIEGKMYYKLSDIKAHLEKNYMRESP